MFISQLWSFFSEKNINVSELIDTSALLWVRVDNSKTLRVHLTHPVLACGKPHKKNKKMKKNFNKWESDWIIYETNWSLFYYLIWETSHFSKYLVLSQKTKQGQCGINNVALNWNCGWMKVEQQVEIWSQGGKGEISQEFFNDKGSILLTICKHIMTRPRNLILILNKNTMTKKLTK